MRRFDEKTLLVKAELEQLLYDFLYEVDFNGGRNATDFYAEDGVFALGETEHVGHAGISKFYNDRAEQVRTQQAGGARLALHTVTNVRTMILDEDHAELHFFNTQYSGAGTAPLAGLVGPSMVVKCMMAARREQDEWRITRLEGRALFVGQDTFLNKMVVQQE